MLKGAPNIIDFTSILKHIEFVKGCSLITADDKHQIFHEIKDSVPHERLCSGGRKTREIIIKILEAEINARTEKTSKARKEKVPSKKAT